MMTKILMFLAILLVLMPCLAADRCVVSVRQAPELVPVVTNYNETNIATVQHFLNHLAPCQWGGACGMHARYITIEAEKVGLRMGEITVRDWDRTRARSLVMDGHRVNTFMDGDVRYYTANLYAGDTRIVTRPELYAILREVMK